MAQIKISALTTGTPQGTDLTPAVDTTDTTQAASGTTKKYVRSSELNYYLHAQGLTTYTAVLAASTTALTVTYANGALGVGATLTNAGAQAALTLDGVTLAVADRVLIKNQAAPAQNGIYTVTTVGTGATNWVLTRATDYDQAAEIVQYGVVLVNQGTVSAGLLYQETGAGPWTIGTTAITFALYTSQSLSIPVLLSQGGTSASLTANNGGIFYSSATAGAILAGTATARQMLQSGSSSAPAWSTATWPATTTASQILYSSSTNVVGEITTAVGGVLITSAGSVPSFLANPSATGRFLQSVSGAASIWSTAAFPTSVGATGTILRSNGTDWLASTATFADTYAVSTLLYASGSNAVSGLATTNRAALGTSATGVPQWLALTDGQLVIGSTAGAPAAANLTAGTGVSISNGSNSITINAGGGGMSWTTTAGTTQAAAVNNGYVSGNAAQTTFTLPATAAVGDHVALEGLGAGGWILTANTGQTIKIGTSTTSSAGTLTSAAGSDNVYVICIVQNTTWRVITTNSAGLTVA